MGNLCGCGTAEEKSPEVTQITSNGRLKNGYYKDSFDRFGDDFCELILSYLSFEHKLKFECVSKQWKRTIFIRQYNLDIDKCLLFFDRTNRSLLSNIWNAFKSDQRKSNTFAREETHLWFCFYDNINIAFIPWFENLTKKCSYIKSVSLCLDRTDAGNDMRKALSIIERIFNIIAENCVHLTTIRLWYEIIFVVPDKVWKQFFEKCGQRLKQIVFIPQRRYHAHSIHCCVIEKFLRFCPNKLSVSPICLNLLMRKNSKILLEPNSRDNRVLFIGNINNDLVDRFTAKYANSLKILSVKIFGESLLQYMSGLNQLTQLESLEISSCFKVDSIDGHLRQIGLNCIKLVSLKLKFRSVGFESHTYWNISLNYFNNLKSFELLSEDSIYMSSEALKYCKKLTHLSLDLSDRMNIFADNIHLYLPQIKVIKTQAGLHMSEQSLKSLAELTNLKVLEVYELRHTASDINDLDSLSDLIKFASIKPEITVYLYLHFYLSANLRNYERKKFKRLNAPKNMILKFCESLR